MLSLSALKGFRGVGTLNIIKKFSASPKKYFSVMINSVK